ncbi:MAG: RNA-binding S4 domain-containing protein [Pseudomonadota bacterium]
MTELSSSSQRLDKWLWCARIFKTRALAGKVIAGKGVRITRNGQTDRTDKPSFGIRPGDTIAIAKDRAIRVIEVIDLAKRRGPAPEAQTLYIDHSDALIRPSDKDFPHA